MVHYNLKFCGMQAAHLNSVGSKQPIHIMVTEPILFLNTQQMTGPFAEKTLALGIRNQWSSPTFGIFLVFLTHSSAVPVSILWINVMVLRADCFAQLELSAWANLGYEKKKKKRDKNQPGFHPNVLPNSTETFPYGSVQVGQFIWDAVINRIS